MKSTSFVLLIVALLALSGLSGMTQGPGGPPSGPPPGMPPGPPPIPPIMAALDVNKDATIDAAEIASAPAALLKLDKNADGALTRDEVCPMPPPGGQMGGPGMGCKAGGPPPDGVQGTCPMNPGTGPGANCPGPGMMMGRGGRGGPGAPPADGVRGTCSMNPGTGPGANCPGGMMMGAGGPGGPGGPGRGPMPICRVLDANADGTIDATELKNASAALLKLDKNADGVLTLDEFAPPPPMGGPGMMGPGGHGMMGRGGPGMMGQGGRGHGN